MNRPPRFHINEATGKVAACRAQVEGRCPFGGKHFDTAAEASKDYESRHLEESIISGTLSRKRIPTGSTMGERYRVPITPPAAATADMRNVSDALSGPAVKREAFIEDYYRARSDVQNRRFPARDDRVKQIIL